MLTVLICPYRVTAQSLTATTPSVEYIYLNSKLVAREGISYTAGTITPGGPPVTVSIATADQFAVLSFAGSAAQRVSLQFTGVTIASSTVSMLNPDSSTLTSLSVGVAGGFVDALTLPTTGTYKILVDPSGTNTGNMTLTLYNVVDIAGPITPDGTALAVSISTPGQNARYTFSGTASQKISLRMSGVTLPGTDVSILKPDSTVLATASFGTPGAFIDTTVLPATGTYTVFVNPQNANIGNLTLNLYTVSDLTGTISFGTALPLNLATPGQNAIYTFSGTANQRVSLRLSSVTLTAVDVFIINPDTSVLASKLNVGTGGGFIDVTVLPVSGTYSVKVDPDAYYTGNVTVNLYDVPADVSGTISPNGSPVVVTLATPGQNGALTFSGTASQRVALKLSSVSITFTRISIVRAGGAEVVLPVLVNTSGTFIEPVALPGTETYTIKVDGDQYYTGNITLTLYDVPADLSGTVTIGGAAVPVTLGAGQNATYTFSGTSGQLLTVHVTGNTITNVNVRLKKPDGTTLTNATSSAASFNLSQQTLPSSGTYSVFIDPSAANAGSLNAAVTSP
jgi:hypothetical protein